MLGFEYTTVVNTPGSYALIPVLRSGLSMLDCTFYTILPWTLELILAFQQLLPDADVPVYHLGIFRDKSTLAPVEYYNKLPNDTTVDLAIVIDPIIATGGTAEAVIQTLKWVPISHLWYNSVC
jgi:uracil phosphoribosyltransferase